MTDIDVEKFGSYDPDIKREEFEGLIQNAFNQLEDPILDWPLILDIFEKGAAYALFLRDKKLPLTVPNFFIEYNRDYLQEITEQQTLFVVTNALKDMFLIAVTEELKNRDRLTLIPNTPESHIAFSSEIEKITGLKSKLVTHNHLGDFQWHLKFSPGENFLFEKGRAAGQTISINVIVTFRNPNHLTRLDITDANWNTIVKDTAILGYNLNELNESDYDQNDLADKVSQFHTCCKLSV